MTASDQEHAVFVITKKLRYDLTAMQGKVTDLLNELAALNIKPEESHTCPQCGVKAQGPNTLAEHVYTSHDGPLPAHWVSVDASVTAEGLGARPSGRAKAA